MGDLSSEVFLGPLHLSQYVIKFDEEGFDDPDVLADLSLDELMNDFGERSGPALPSIAAVSPRPPPPTITPLHQA